MLFALLQYGMKSYSNQNMWNWQKDWHVDQWKMNESAEMNSYLRLIDYQQNYQDDSMGKG